jgi:hypothetical protein
MIASDPSTYWEESICHSLLDRHSHRFACSRVVVDLLADLRPTGCRIGYQQRLPVGWSVDRGGQAVDRVRHWMWSNRAYRPLLESCVKMACVRDEGLTNPANRCRPACLALQCSSKNPGQVLAFMCLTES